MALQLLAQTEVYYGKQKRILSLQEGDLSALSEQDKVTYLALSALPNDYAPVAGSVIQYLDKKGISVRKLAEDKLADYRGKYPCWISKDVKNTSFKRIAVYEPSGKQEAYESICYLFSAIREAQENKTEPITAALPLLCTGSAGADKTEMLERIFFAAAHFCGMEFPFSEIKIVLLYKEDALVKKFKQLCEVYQDLSRIELPAEYEYPHYAHIAAEHIGKKKLPENLTYRQAFGICMYTTNFYLTINGVLRNRECKYDIYKKLLPLFEAIDTGLMNLASFTGKTYRGEQSMSKERLEQNAKGKTVCNLAYTSSSYNPGGYYLRPYRFVFDSCYGVVIEDYSAYPGEKEVLFGQQMHYLVKDVKQEGYWRFDAQELPQELRR